jgi:hypothetical protein
MAGRTCLVTGATSGIGKATATALARLGADLVLVARDRAKGEATVTEIETATGNSRLELLVADLASQASLRGLAEEYQERHDRLHVLVNNAGGSWATRHTTVDGLELTFALNHLAYFLLTNLLLEVLVASAPARIVNVTSGAQAVGDIHFDDLQSRAALPGLGRLQPVQAGQRAVHLRAGQPPGGQRGDRHLRCSGGGPQQLRSRRLGPAHAPALAAGAPLHANPRAGRRHPPLPRLLPRRGGRDRQILREPAREAVLQAVL